LDSNDVWILNILLNAVVRQINLKYFDL